LLVQPPLPAQFFTFFFYCYVATRYLHSFPTRRSSDLLWRTASRNRSSSRRFQLVRSALSQQALKRKRPWGRGAAAPTDVSFLARSEEHTSELQSRFDLVCRLLLEKKKRSCIYLHRRST